MSQNLLFVGAVFFLLFIAAIVMTGLLRKLSIKNNWFDWPSDRGSHSVPVPNIGGLAMCLILIPTILSLMGFGGFTISQGLIWLLIVFGLGLLGFVDDIKDLSTQLRLCIQIIIALIVVSQLGGINHIRLGIFEIEFGKLAYLLGFFWVVGFINMYNFMDGINGLAGCQGVIAGLTIALWLFHFGLTAQGLLFVSFAAVCGGFLYWNITPARVFMGDSGSTMLGGAFAAISLQLHNELDVSIVYPILLFAWFAFDTSFTLIKRLLKGEKIWLAHRQHLYQRLAQTPENHLKVTGMISLLALIIALVITIVLFKQL